MSSWYKAESYEPIIEHQGYYEQIKGRSNYRRDHRDCSNDHGSGTEDSIRSKLGRIIGDPTYFFCIPEQFLYYLYCLVDAPRSVSEGGIPEPQSIYDQWDLDLLPDSGSVYDGLGRLSSRRQCFRILLLWSLAFQWLDYQIRKDNPGTAKEPSNRFAFRLFMYVIFGICIILSFIRPPFSLYLIWGSTIVMLIWTFFSKRQA